MAKIAERRKNMIFRFCTCHKEEQTLNIDGGEDEIFMEFLCLYTESSIDIETFLRFETQFFYAKSIEFDDREYFFDEICRKVYLLM
jgi:hypothetical protein